MAKVDVTETQKQIRELESEISIQNRLGNTEKAQELGMRKRILERTLLNT